MTEKKQYNVPSPIIDLKEENSLDELTERYNKMVEPSKLAKVGTKVVGIVPDKLKHLGNGVKETISQEKLYKQTMKVIADGFKIVEEQAAKFSISETTIINKVNNIVPGNNISQLNEICFARSYDLAKVVNSYKNQNLGFAFVEGGATGVFGFAGLPFNIVLSTFLYYRAVQSVAMFYGYDVKNDATELIIAGDVFMNALSPGKSNVNEVSDLIGKIMLMSKVSAVRQTAKKTWTDMASRGGVELLLTQMRAMANKSAQKALKNAGQKGLEKSIFKDIFEQMGKNLGLKTIQRAVPVVSGVIGALFDTAQMKRVLEYADVFYNKRYILEKEKRINTVVTGTDEIIVDL